MINPISCTYKNLKVLRLLSVFIGVLLVSSSCESDDKEENTLNTTRNIFKIYDRANLLAAEAVDLVELRNGEFLIVGVESKFDGSAVRAEKLLIIRADAQGNIIRETAFEEYGAPIDRLIPLGVEYLAFCIKKSDDTLVGVKISEAGDVNEMPVPPELRYGKRILPLPRSGYLFLTLDLTGQRSRLFRLNESFQISDTLANHTFNLSAFGNGTLDIEKALNLGMAGEQFYFYAPRSNVMGLFFENEIDTLTYFDPWWLDAILDLGNGDFSIVNKQPNPEADLQVYFLNEIPYGEMGSYPDYYDNEQVLFGLDSEKKTFMQKVGNNIVVVGTQRTGQVAVYVYDQSGKQIIREEIGESFPYEANRIQPTADGGLAVLGTTELTFEFPRIFLYKLSAEKLR